MKIELSSVNKPGASLTTVEIEPENLRGSRTAFGPILHISAMIAPTSAHKPLLFDGTLCWKAEQYGKLIPMQCMRTGTAELIVPMTDHEIAALERVRDGGSAIFQIRLRAIGFPDDTNTIGVYAPVSFHYQEFKVHLEKWHEVLRGFGFGDFRVVELPAPPADPPGAWTRARDLLLLAAASLSSGENGSAKTNTRAAIIELAEVIGDRVGVERSPTNFRLYVDRTRSKLKELHRLHGNDPFALLGDLMYSAFGFTSEPTHKGLDIAPRDEATFALSAATALYTYLVKAGLRLIPLTATVEPVADESASKHRSAD